MNLHGIVAGAIGAVNPFVQATFQVSAGFAVGADGTPVPTYAAPISVSAQVQPMTYKDLIQVDGLNLNGTKRSIYVHGRFDGIVRSLAKGGDLVTVASGVNRGVWLVAMVLEQWPDWVKVAVTLQNDAVQ